MNKSTIKDLKYIVFSEIGLTGTRDLKLRLENPAQ